MVPIQIIRMLNVFDCFGYNSGWSRVSKRKRNSYLISAVHSLVATFFVFYEFRLAKIYYSRMILSEAISECLQYTAALYTYWLIIFDSCFLHHTHKQFWDTVDYIDQHFYDQIEFTLRSYMMKFIIFLIKTMISVVVRMMGNSFAGFEIDTPYVVLFTICDLRMFYYLFCLEIVYFQLKVIELKSEKIKSLLNPKNHGEIRKMRHSAHIGIVSSKSQHMKWIRDYSHCVHEMVCLLNKIFGWSNVATISLCFCFLLTEIYWYYVHHDVSFLYKFSESL